jgi:hypothetical protein
MSVSEVQSLEVHEIAKGVSILYSAWFGPSLFGATLSTASTAQTSGTTTLTIGAGAINNGGPVNVDGVSRPINTVVQFRVTVPSNAVAGPYEVTVTVTTSTSDTRKLRCQLLVA